MKKRIKDIFKEVFATSISNNERKCIPVNDTKDVSLIFFYSATDTTESLYIKEDWGDEEKTIGIIFNSLNDNVFSRSKKKTEIKISDQLETLELGYNTISDFLSKVRELHMTGITLTYHEERL